MKFLRFLLGVAVFGPLAGLVRALLTPTAALFGLVGAGAAFALTTSVVGTGTAAALSVSMPTILATATIMHLFAFAGESVYWYFKNSNRTIISDKNNFTPEQYNALHNLEEFFEDRLVEEHTPVAKAFITGFDIANHVGGEGNRIYGGRETAEFIDQCDGVYSPNRYNH